MIRQSVSHFLFIFQQGRIGDRDKCPEGCLDIDIVWWEYSYDDDDDEDDCG